MAVQRYMIGSVVYFTLLFVVVSLFSISGVFTGNEVVTNVEFSSSLQSSNINDTQNVNDLGFNHRSYFKDIFSFFAWNINVYEGITLMSYFWIFRIVFVYIPILILILNIYYSLPTIAG